MRNKHNFHKYFFNRLSLQFFSTLAQEYRMYLKSQTYFRRNREGQTTHVRCILRLSNGIDQSLIYSFWIFKFKQITISLVLALN